MREKTVKWLAYGSWIIALLLGLTLVLGYSALQANVARLAREADVAKAELKAARLEFARAHVQANVLNAAVLELRQYQDLLTKRSREQADFCNHLRRPGMALDSGVVTLCANYGERGVEPVSGYQAFMDAFTQAASLRAEGKFSDSAKAYESAAKALADMPMLIPRDRAMRVALTSEGRAYAAYRLGDLGNARTLIEQAQRADGTLGFVASTALKIGCASGQTGNAAEVRDRNLAALVAAIQTGRSEGPDWIEFRESDRRFFETDEELKLVCDL